MPRQPRILVADDDRSFVWIWMRILQHECGAEVVAVFDGTAAIAKLRTVRFDLVVSDLQMPGASGLDVLRCAKALDPTLPVLLATGDASDHLLAEAARLGAREVLRKPFDFDVAIALATELLAERLAPSTVGSGHAITA